MASTWCIKCSLLGTHRHRPPTPFIMSSPSPSPHLRDFQKYSEDVPSSGARPREGNLDNYFDYTIPAPHRMSGSYLSPQASPRASMESLHGRPLSSGTQPAYGGHGPRYLSPLAASAATETEGAGLRDSNYSGMSMIGLNSTPGLQRKSTWLEKQQTYKKKNHRLVRCNNIHSIAQILLCSYLASSL